jgi:hypothetical protein
MYIWLLATTNLPCFFIYVDALTYKNYYKKLCSGDVESKIKFMFIGCFVRKSIETALRILAQVKPCVLH